MHKKFLKPEILWKIIEEQGDLSGWKYQKEKWISLGAMKYLPHAIYKLFESMPNPWENNKKVNVVYHITGALSIINETPKMNEIIYRTLWAI